MARASIEDPLKKFRFRIIVDGFQRAGFSKCEGLEKTTEEATYREGGQNETKQKSAGLTNYSDLTLERGQIVGSQRGGDNDFITWADQVNQVSAAGNAANYRKDLDIQQFSAQNVRMRVWRVYEAWPKVFKPVGPLDASSSENSVEVIVLANEGWEPVQ